MIQVDRVTLDDKLTGDLMTAAQKYHRNTISVQETFLSIFWKQQVKASCVKSSKGIRWHSAIIRWCLTCITNPVAAIKYYVTQEYCTYHQRERYMTTDITHHQIQGSLKPLTWICWML